MNADTVAALPLLHNGKPLPAPNPYQTWQDVISEAILAMQDDGDAYLYLSPQASISVLPDDDVVAKWDSTDTYRVYERSSGVPFRENPSDPARNLLVVSMNRGASDLTGVGPMESPRLAGILAAQSYSRTTSRTTPTRQACLKCQRR